MALFHLGELVLPVAGELGLGQVLDAEAAQQRHQLERLRARHELAPFAVDVLLVDQALDDRGARRRGAEALFLHRLAQLVVVDQLAGAFHRREQRRLGVARRRLGLERLDVDALGARQLVLGDRDQVRVVLLRLAPVDREPAGLDHHLAVGLEPEFLAGLGDGRDPRRHHELGRREEDGEEALGDHVVELGLDLRQALRRQQGRDDREVVRDLGVVEDLLRRLDVALLQRRLGMDGERAQRPGQGLLGDHLDRLARDRDVVLGQGAAVGARIGEHLVLLVERLRDRERRPRREAEARVGLALQAGQVVEQRRGLRARLGLFRHARRLALHRLGDSERVGLVPEPVRARSSASSGFFFQVGSNHLPSYSPAP